MKEEEKMKILKNKKGQGAMEYLMTYFLVTLILSISLFGSLKSNANRIPNVEGNSIELKVLKYYVGGKEIEHEHRDLLRGLAGVGLIKYGLKVKTGHGTACTTPLGRKMI